MHGLLRRGIALGAVVLLAACSGKGAGDSAASDGGSSDGGSSDGGAGDGGSGDGGSGDGGSGDGGELPPECAAPQQDRVHTCPGLWVSTGDVVGHFTVWEAGDDDRRTWRLTTTEGEENELEVYGASADLPPPLAALDTLGAVHVHAGGGCASDGEGGYGGAFVISDGEGAVLAVGTGALDEAGLRVDWEADGGGCGARAVTGGCVDSVINAAVRFSAGEHELVLHQGEAGELGPYGVELRAGELPAGESHCDDAIGFSMNYLIWRR